MKDALIEYETIDSDQIDDIMEGKKPRPPRIGQIQIPTKLVDQEKLKMNQIRLLQSAIQLRALIMLL